MQTQTLLLLLAAFVVALGVALWQYRQATLSKRIKAALAVLRFVLLFCGFLLLINPKFTKNSYYTEKPNLLVLADGSSSIAHLQATEELQLAVENISTSQELNERFTIATFGFTNAVTPLDSLQSSGSITNISKALASLKETYRGTPNAVVLLSDGNQTLGRDYEYFELDSQDQLNTIVVGDTTQYEDLSIGLINTNKYAFLDNQFPLEAQLLYNGSNTQRTEFRIRLEGRVVHRQIINFSQRERAKLINVLLQAQSTGIKEIALELTPLPNEKNELNNNKAVAIEVIDEKTVVGIVSSFKHPDLGTLKAAIESNEQREVQYLAPNEPITTLESVDVFILYQPDASFTPIYDFISERGGGSFTITGSQTDWSFLTSRERGLSLESFGQEEEILGVKNAAFDLFDTASFSFEGFPPLQGQLGDLLITQEAKVLAYQQIKGVSLNDPLFFILEGDDRRAFLLGENIWKWRMATYRNNQDFSNFDEMIGKLLFYLANATKKERLQLAYKNVFENASEAQIRASFFDKAFDFDPDATLSLQLNNAEGLVREVPMLLSGNHFQVDLQDLEKGDYTFTVTETRERLSKSGSFRILDFDVEQQFLSANAKKLERVATNNGGKAYYPDQEQELINDLLANNQFLPVQKSTKNVVSLIDFSVVLAIMVLALATEWFLRKYNGLI